MLQLSFEWESSVSELAHEHTRPRFVSQRSRLNVASRLRKALSRMGEDSQEMSYLVTVLFSFSKVSELTTVREEQHPGQRGIEGVVPTVSEEIVGCLPLELMPSHNDLAVPQPASTGHELWSKYS